LRNHESDRHTLGVDEIHWGRGLRADNFLTVIYQIDAHCAFDFDRLRSGPHHGAGPGRLPLLPGMCSTTTFPHIFKSLAHERTALSATRRL
jgi:hypothetical protein